MENKSQVDPWLVPEIFSRWTGESGDNTGAYETEVHECMPEVVRTLMHANVLNALSSLRTVCVLSGKQVKFLQYQQTTNPADHTIEAQEDLREMESLLSACREAICKFCQFETQSERVCFPEGKQQHQAEDSGSV